MSRFRKTASAVALGAGLLCANGAQAVSTDGYHTIQIIPIAVQTASFTTSFYFHAPVTNTNVQVIYYPGNGTATPGPVNCGVKAVAVDAVATYASLSALCPGITAGSNFGWLYTYEVDATNHPYAVFTRVDNPQGQGFEVESFPAHTLTASTAHVLGLKRTAAAPGASTNCFIGAISEPVSLQLSLWNSAGTQIGATQSYTLLTNEFRRLSDIFAVVGAPAGDYSNVRLRMFESGAGEPSVLTFCTVQNNTTFDADFRIAKGYFMEDNHANRFLSRSTNSDGSAFTLGTYPNERNRHVVYFRHPDWVQCSVNRTDGGLLTDLEMRLLDQNGTVIAGGSDVQSFGEVYLGNKSTRGGGWNTWYYLDVESTGASGATYGVDCQSGSGASGLFIESRNQPDLF